MESYSTTVDAIREISRAESFEDAWEALIKGCAKLEVKLGSYAFGFPSSAVLEGIVCSTLPIEAEGVSKHAYDAEFLDLYYERQFFEYDTTVLWASQHTQPALWTEIDRPIVDGQWGGKFADLYHMARDFGLRNGAIIPLRKRTEAAIGGLVVVTDSVLDSAQADRLLTERLPALQQLAEAFHLYRPISRLAAEKIGLSKREKECLQYLCQGFSQKRISRRFERHDRTVQKQIASAKRKLNAQTATQAVIKALAYELIEP